jgi:hypothetical protein
MKQVIFILALCMSILLPSCKSDLEKHCGEKIISKVKLPDINNGDKDEDGKYYSFRFSFLSNDKSPDLKEISVTRQTWYHYQEGDTIDCRNKIVSKSQE